MKDVWILFRVLEMGCAFIALAFHVAAILNPNHPMEHVMHLCGTFLGFLLLGLSMNIGMILKQQIPILYEAIIATCGFVLFIFAAFSTMFLAERDDDLKFLLDYEEEELSNFIYYKGQIASIICMGIHIAGFLYSEEPDVHIVFFCGTFFGFGVTEILLNVGYNLGVIMPVFLEAIIAFTAFVLFITSSILSSYYNEIDLHLEYLSDDEEVQHTFFTHSRKQSVASLVAGIIYLLHAIFATDYLVSTAINQKGKRRVTEIFNDPGDETEEPPFKLHFFCKPIFQISTCCNICNRKRQLPSFAE